VDRYGIRASVPGGWSLRIDRRVPATAAVTGVTGAFAGPGLAEASYPVLHASTLSLPGDVGDFGSGLWQRLGPDDVFVALLEFGPQDVGSGLFADRGVPVLAPSHFATNRLPQYLPGRSAAQRFFSEAGRTFCLFAVIGAHWRRMATVPKAAEVVRGIRIAPAGAVRGTS
jgi:hypothetical protein